MTDDQLFQKKQECAEYKEKAIKLIKEYDDEITKIEKDQWIFMKHTRSLWEIFYSPVKNSCLYSTNVIEETDGIITDFYIFKDLFNKEYDEGIIIQDENRNLDNEKSFIAYKQRLKELKWE